ncbi:MAG: ABC transporter substrate-binding protein [Armatimonadota bacterium]|nr:ABC transporter substrate-binding protein [Armatimonadota bacterium]
MRAGYDVPRWWGGIGRTALALVAGLALLVGVLAPWVDPATAGPAGGKLRLRFGSSSPEVVLVPNVVTRIAEDMGFYEREGLEVEQVAVTGTPALIVALRTGQVDIANVATEDTLRLTATKAIELRAVHSPDAKLYFLIASKREIGSLGDLRGKLFAIARPGSLDHSLTEMVLEQAGMTGRELRMLAIGAPAVRAQALLAGRVDATTFSVGTWMTVRSSPALKVLVDHDAFYAAAPIVQKVNAVTLATLREKPEHLRRFTAAIIKASRHLAENKQTWLDIMTKRRSDVRPQDLADLWEFYKTSWAVNGLMNLGEYIKTADFLYQTDDFKQVPKIPVWDWVDVRFVDSVLKEIGVYSRFDNPGRPIR